MSKGAGSANRLWAILNPRRRRNSTLTSRGQGPRFGEGMKRSKTPQSEKQDPSVLAAKADSGKNCSNSEQFCLQMLSNSAARKRVNETNEGPCPAVLRVLQASKL